MKLIIFILLSFTFSNLTLSQGEGNNWYFGQYAGLSFSTNPPTILTNGRLTTGEGCSSVSGKDGSLVFYTDGSFVWDANHNLMPNGSGLLGDPSSTQSAVVCPKPGTYNYSLQRYDGYYIVTIDFLLGPNGVRFSEVNMTLNGGMGDVIPTNKNILLFGTTTMEGASVARHANGCDYWIIGKPLGNNNILTYQVTAAGINLTPIISSTGPVINQGWGTIKASPDSKIIGLASNGSGVNRTNIYDFNNATGAVTHRYTSNFGGYSLEFSPNSQILYATLLSDPNIYQYNLNTLTQAAFLASQTIIGTTANTTGYRMAGLQMAPNGKIYAALHDQSRLGAINNPNILGVGCNYNDNEQSLIGTNTFSGTAMLSKLGLPAFPTFFLSPPVRVQSSYLCFEDITEFELTDTSDIDSVSWFWSSLGSPLPNIANSTAWEPTIQYANPGTYTIMAILHYPCFKDSIYDTLTITQVNNVFLGNDTTFCRGNSLELDAGSGYDYYEWQDGSTSQTFTVNNSGQYSVDVFNTGENLVTNSDFQQGNVGFSSDYNFATSAPGQGGYSVTTYSNTWFGGCSDHTTGSGMMLEVDAGCGTNGVAAGANIWCQIINVSPNTDYLFSTWFASAISGYAPASLALYINGAQLGNPMPTAATCQWLELYDTWNSGANTSIEICIRELTGICYGSDYTLDDIYFGPICKKTDTIEVIVGEIPVANFSVIDSCEYIAVTFNDLSTIATPEAIVNWSWDMNNDGTEDYTIQNPSHFFPAGNHTNRLSVTSALGCSKDTLLSLHTHPKPQANFTFIERCQYDSLSFVNTSAVGAPDNISNYSWNFGETPLPGIQSILMNPNHTFASAGTFNVTQIVETNNGCLDTMVSQVSVFNAPIADFTFVAQCQNDSVPFNSISSVSPPSLITTYQWVFGNGQVSPLSNPKVIFAAAGTYTVELIATTNNNCRDTIEHLVTINPLPTAQLIGGESLCLNSGTPTIEFIGENGQNPYTFSYTINNGSLQTINSSVGQNNAVLNLDASTAGTTTYNLVSVSESDFNCSQNQNGTAVITIHPEPIAAFQPNPSSIMISDNVSQMINTSIGAISYDWNFSDGTSSFEFSPYHQFEIDHQEYFSIQLIATSEFGCFSITTEEIMVNEDELIYIPNTFTPNGNEYNSVFIPVLDDRTKIYEYQMEIYNRWGERIFTTKDISIGWDGTYNGDYCPTGTYTWVMSYKVKNHPNRRVLNGHVNILK